MDVICVSCHLASALLRVIKTSYGALSRKKWWANKHIRDNFRKLFRRILVGSKNTVAATILIILYYFIKVSTYRGKGY